MTSLRGSEGSRIVYITEKAVHQHAQNITFGLFAAAWLFTVDQLVSYPLVFIHLSQRVMRRSCETTEVC